MHHLLPWQLGMLFCNYELYSKHDAMALQILLELDLKIPKLANVGYMYLFVCYLLPLQQGI